MVPAGKGVEVVTSRGGGTRVVWVGSMHGLLGILSRMRSFSSRSCVFPSIVVGLLRVGFARLRRRRSCAAAWMKWLSIGILRERGMAFVTAAAGRSTNNSKNRRLLVRVVERFFGAPWSAGVDGGKRWRWSCWLMV